VEASAERGAENTTHRRGWQGEQIDEGLLEGLLLLGDVLGSRVGQERFAVDQPLQQRERLLLGREGDQVVEVQCLWQRRVSSRHPFLRFALAALASSGRFVSLETDADRLLPPQVTGENFDDSPTFGL